MPAKTRTKRRPKTMTPAGIAEAVALMAEEYGPFPEERRLPPADEMVFTILSQHTSDTNSSRAYNRLMERFVSLDAVARADVADIEEAIAPGGLAKIKAPRIKQVLSRVMELTGGSLDLSFLAEMPLAEAKSWLRGLPGIGPKSAGIVLNFSLGMPAMAVDTHIYRVCQRLRIIAPKTSVDQAHDILEAKVPPEEVFNFHVALINHGRQVCKAQHPQCPQCVVSRICPSRKQFAANGTKSQASGASRKDVGRKDAGRLPHVPISSG
jgi:endonuclease-3